MYFDQFFVYLQRLKDIRGSVDKVFESAQDTMVNDRSLLLTIEEVQKERYRKIRILSDCYGTQIPDEASKDKRR